MLALVINIVLLIGDVIDSYLKALHHKLHKKSHREHMLCEAIPKFQIKRFNLNFLFKELNFQEA